MPHFSADLLDAVLHGDPAELEALRAFLGAGPDRCAGRRPAPLPIPRPAMSVPTGIARQRRQAFEARAMKRRPGPVSGTRLRPPMPG
ncbi:hypothetical protein [Methylobacterium frigidaeris]|uniref:Uncharacterized protein n=1 Tax=Methylobacterium frigidaeris TaxID=2038277 RepID=A0AA37M2U2_9HYPH|nr:hypothetical protein [Methylobacterium frigidaeris]PIK70982.1 hypothetical protein CS379_21790 [Methylobacterium frigidaeris]GJD60667.1 hypothetical protein MPEAHAMD_0806 [Methylobacterium frigidaeris]